MEILTISGPLHREFGGPPKAATGVAASLGFIGHQVAVIVCGQSEKDSNLNSTFFEYLDRSGVKVKVLRRRNESKYGALIRLNEIIGLFKAISKSDFVILHQVFALQYIVVFPMLIMAKKPYAVMPHGTLTDYQRKQHRFRKFIFSPVTYLFLNLSRAIFLATEQEKAQLPLYLKKIGIVVGLGVELPDTDFQQTKRSIQSFNLLYMGRITKKKRLDMALKSFASASKSSSLNMKFIVCGSGPEREVAVVKNLARSLHIEDKVEFRGWVDVYEKELALSESDCFILTSEDENFAIAAAEALAHGIPCILSSNVALSSLVSKYQAGVVFQELSFAEIENAILKVSTFDRDDLRDASLRASTEMSWDVVAKQWHSTINRLLKN